MLIFFNDYVKNMLGIEPRLVDTYVCIHQPHTLKQFIRRNIWYGRTVSFYLRKRNILWSFRGLRRLIGPSALLIPPLLIVISLLLGNLILLILGLGLFIEQTYKVTIKKAFNYSKLPSAYRSLNVFLTSVALANLVRPFTWGLGVADYFFRRIAGRNIKRGKD